MKVAKVVKIRIKKDNITVVAYADKDGVVRVYDAVAQHYTVCHRLTPGQERYVRSRTQKENSVD